MQLRQLLNDDDAVSPVIGVILMVAITVILAAVIATFVLGLGEQVSDTAPQASFSFDYEEGASTADIGSSGDGVLTIRHSGGASIEAGQLGISGSTPAGNSDWTDAGISASSEISAGSQITIAVDNTDTIAVTWTNDQGTSSATLQEWSGPQA